MPYSYRAPSALLWTEPLPRLVILDTRTCQGHFESLEDEIEQTVDRSKMLMEIIQCIKVDDATDLNLNLYCMELVDKHCLGEIYSEFSTLLQYVERIGRTLNQLVKMHRLYRRGEMPYIARRIRAGGIELMRRDAALKENKEVLAEQEMRERFTENMERLARLRRAQATPHG